MRLVLSLVAVLVTLGLGGFFFISTDKRAALQASTAASACRSVRNPKAWRLRPMGLRRVSSSDKSLGPALRAPRFPWRRCG